MDHSKNDNDNISNVNDASSSTTTTSSSTPWAYFDSWKNPRPIFPNSIAELPDLKKSPVPLHWLLKGQTPEEKAGQQLAESCAVKAVISFVGGYGLGAMFGLIMDSGAPVGENTSMTKVLKDTWVRMKSTGKNFALFGIVISSVDCAVETYRGRTDEKNIVYGGCITGAALGYRMGGRAALGTCAGFAAMSVAMERFMHG